MPLLRLKRFFSAKRGGRDITMRQGTLDGFPDRGLEQEPELVQVVFPELGAPLVLARLLGHEPLEFLDCLVYSGPIAARAFETGQEPAHHLFSVHTLFYSGYPKRFWGINNQNDSIRNHVNPTRLRGLHSPQ